MECLKSVGEITIFFEIIKTKARDTFLIDMLVFFQNF